MKNKQSIFVTLALYFPVILILFGALKEAYEKYKEIKESQSQVPTILTPKQANETID